MPNKNKTISVNEIVRNIFYIFDIDMNFSKIPNTTPNEVIELILREYNFRYCDHVGIANRIMYNMHLYVKELSNLALYFNSSYPLDVTVVYENKYLLKYNCLLHIFSSDGQVDKIEKISLMSIKKVELPLYFSFHSTDKEINITFNLIPDFPQLIYNLSNLDSYKIISCCYKIKPN